MGDSHAAPLRENKLRVIKVKVTVSKWKLSFEKSAPRNFLQWREYLKIKKKTGPVLFASRNPFADGAHRLLRSGRKPSFCLLGTNSLRRIHCAFFHSGFRQKHPNRKDAFCIRERF